MKYTHTLLLLSFLCLLPLNSCRKALGDLANIAANGTNSIVGTLDKVANDLNANASNFNSIIEEAIAEIEDQDIKNDLELLLNNAITLVGTEIRCNIQFTIDYLLKGINSIKANLLEEESPTIRPVVCAVIPESINMKLKPNDRDEIIVTGYFFKEGSSNFKLYHYSIHGTEREVSSKISSITDFKLLINLGRNGVSLNDSSDKLVLKWNDDIISEIPIIQPHLEPCKLRSRSIG